MARTKIAKMTIKMLASKPGSPDGINVNTYLEGEVYELPTSLAKVFIAEKWAEETDGEETAGGDVDSGGATGFIILPKGMVTRGELAKDELNNKQLIEYAVAHLEIGEGTIKMNTKHSTLLESIISTQEDWENANQELLTKED